MRKFARCALVIAVTGTGATLMPTAARAAALQPDGASFGAAISADGTEVVFVSYATNLTPGETDGIYVRDLTCGVTRHVTGLPTGEPPTTQSLGTPRLSADGRYVAFASTARNLVPDDDNGVRDLFVRDLWTGRNRRVNVSTTGIPAYRPVGDYAMSADGRWVAFSSGAGLVPEDTNEGSDVFVRDLWRGTTSRVTVDGRGRQTHTTYASTPVPLLSPDGRYVVFNSDAPDLVPGDPNGVDDVFLRDRRTGRTELISVATSGERGDDASPSPAGISPDGRYVLFRSRAANLAPGGAGGEFRSYVRDRRLGTTRLLRPGEEAGNAGNGYWGNPAVSADGRFALENTSDALLPEDTNGLPDGYVRDRDRGTVVRATVGPAVRTAPPAVGPAQSSPSVVSAISDDGRTAAIVRDDSATYGAAHSGYLRDVSAGSTVRLPSHPAPTPVPFVSTGDFDEDISITPDGRFLAYAGSLQYLTFTVGVFDRVADTVVRGDAGLPVQGAGHPALSADGRTLAFEYGGGIYVRDLHAGTAPVRVDRGAGGSGPLLDGTGRFLVFESTAASLVAGDTNGTADVFVLDRWAGSIRRVSAPPPGGTGGGTRPVISGDGRFVAFESVAPDLVAGDTNGAPDVFVHDRWTGGTQRISVGAAGQADGGSREPSISADGRYVAFTSAAANLVTGDTNGASDVFVRDRWTGTTRRIGLDSAGRQLGGGATRPILATDGRYLAFTSISADAVPGDANGAQDGFVKDLTTGTVLRVTEYPPA